MTLRHCRALIKVWGFFLKEEGYKMLIEIVNKLILTETVDLFGFKHFPSVCNPNINSMVFKPENRK